MDENANSSQEIPSLVGSVPIDADVCALSLSGDGDLLACGTTDTVLIWTIPQLQLLDTPQLQMHANHVDYDEDWVTCLQWLVFNGHSSLIIGTNRGDTIIWTSENTCNGDVLFRESMAWSIDGSPILDLALCQTSTIAPRAAALTHNGTIFVWEISLGFRHPVLSTQMSPQHWSDTLEFLSPSSLRVYTFEGLIMLFSTNPNEEQVSLVADVNKRLSCVKSSARYDWIMYTETGLIPDIIIRLHRSDGQLLWVEQVHSETFRLDTGALNGPAIIRVPCLFIEDDSRIVIGLPNGHLISYDAHLEDGGKFTGPHTYLCADHGASYISTDRQSKYLVAGGQQGKHSKITLWRTTH